MQPSTSTAILTLGVVMLAAGGCAHRGPNPFPPLTDQQLAREQQANAQRLAGRNGPEPGSQRLSPKPPKPVFGQAWNLIKELYNYYTGNTPALAARNMLEPRQPDKRREGIFYLARRSFGRREPYTRRYAQMAETDEDFTVRAAAVRALNWSREKQYTGIYLRLLSDSSAWVRLEAAKALANMPDQAALAALIRRMEDPEEDRDVRIAAADALRNFPTGQAGQALVRVLGDKDFAVAWQSRKSLRLLTGRDLGYNQSAWLEHLARSDKPFISG